MTAIAKQLAELRWRREVMSEAKDRLASGNAAAAYNALTRHEDEGYPWAPGIVGNMGPDYAHRHAR